MVTTVSAQLESTVPPTRAHHDLAAEEADWREWIDAVCADLGIGVGAVDVTVIHELSRIVARGVARPLAPVSTVLLGLAVGQGIPRDDALARIAAHAGSRP